MNATQAMTKLRKLLGPRAAIRDTGKPSSPEQREQNSVVFRAALEAKAAADAALAERKKVLLAADAEYQRLLTEYRAAVIAHNQAPSPHAYRYIAGVSGSIFFSVEADADNLAELVAKVEAKRTKQAA